MTWTSCEAICECGQTYQKKSPNATRCPKCREVRSREIKRNYYHRNSDKINPQKRLSRQKVSFQAWRIIPDTVYWQDETWTEPDPIMIPLFGGERIQTWKPWE